KPGHVKPECPDAQKKTQPKWKKNKPKAMIGTWSEEEDDEDEENSEDDENESIICLQSFYKSRSTLLDSKVDSTSLPSKFLKNKLPVRSTLLDSKINSTSLLSKFLKNKLPVR
ncbi:hypothetical protein Taro_047389, partial [Colocasia esculenta]|nr:hypothetical protein [Colocasia esculenta]